MKKEDVLNLAKEANVKYIRLCFTDINGTLKSVEIPSSRLEYALDGKCMFDGSSIEGFNRIIEADMFLKPDLDTWLVLEYEQLNCDGKVARLICDVYDTSGKPFVGDPRYVLKQMIKKMQEKGYKSLNIGFEPEFFLFRKDENDEMSLNPNDLGSYFDLSPIDTAEDCRRDIVLELEKLGFNVEASHHEVSNGQHEINFHFNDCLKACDLLQTYKIVVKNIANRHKLHATFMPKPLKGVNGNGLHVNCSLVDKEGNNAFHDITDDLGLSKVARKWITGVLQHARGLSAITNPTVNSYKRLIPGYEAPTYISWSEHNRSVMIRIPKITKDNLNSVRTEIRNVDSSCNPYLAIAAILAVGLDGIDNNEYIDSINVNLFALTEEERHKIGAYDLPRDLREALQELSNDSVIKKALGEHVYQMFMAEKQAEWKEYIKEISDWEIKKYCNL